MTFAVDDVPVMESWRGCYRSLGATMYWFSFEERARLRELWRVGPVDLVESRMRLTLGRIWIASGHSEWPTLPRPYRFRTPPMAVAVPAEMWATRTDPISHQERSATYRKRAAHVTDPRETPTPRAMQACSCSLAGWDAPVRFPETPFWLMEPLPRVRSPLFCAGCGVELPRRAGRTPTSHCRACALSRQAARKALHQCVACGGDAAVGYTACHRCRATQRQAKRRLHLARKTAGVCIWCGDVLVAGRQQCARHLQKARQQARARRHRAGR